jgi:hypothetical protein
MAWRGPVFILDLLFPFRHRILNSRGTEDWTRDGHRLLDGFWPKECLVVGFLGFGVCVEVCVLVFGFWVEGSVLVCRGVWIWAFDV